MKIISISDTHNRHENIKIPKCDILIHCGDWTSLGKYSEVRNFAQWLDKQDAKHIILIPGNHELEFEGKFPESRSWITDFCPRANLLVDESVVIEGIKFHGSPATPFFCDWAWNRTKNDAPTRHYIGNEQEKLIQPIKPHWDKIPDDVNVLITHGPPHGILDQTTFADGEPRPERLGCELLMNRIKELKDLDLHFFGHIHAPGGQQVHRDGVSFYNSSICDEAYYPSNPITEVDYVK